MKVLNGKDGLLYMLVDEQWVPILCATDVAFQFDHEEVLKTGPNSGKFRERITRLCDWSMTLSGLTGVDNSGDKLSFFWLTQDAVRGTVRTVRLTYTDAFGGQTSIVGNVLVKSGNISSSVSSFTTVSMELPGTGSFSADYIANPSPEGIYKLYIATVAGQSSVQHDDLKNALELMMVIREDGLYKEISGTPVGRTVKSNLLTGTITFSTDLPFLDGEVVYCQYKK